MTWLFFANLGLWLGVYAPIQVLLPQQAALLDHANKELVFGLVTGAGAIAALLANPTIGLLSDRTTSRFGRRHPWTLTGALIGAAGLVVLSNAPTITVMTIGWCLVQAGLNGMLASLTSAVPDQVPVRQRATVGGLVGISQMLGTVLGALVVTVFVTGLMNGYLACAAIVVGGALVFVLLTPDVRLPKSARPSFVLREMWISPKAHPDFSWAWGCHFMINLGNAFGTLYLLFFLADVVHHPSPEDGLLVLMGFYGVAVIIGAGVRGDAARRLADVDVRADRGPVAGTGFRHVPSRGAGVAHPGAARRGGPREGPRRGQHRERAASSRRPVVDRDRAREPRRLPRAVRGVRARHTHRRVPGDPRSVRFLVLEAVRAVGRQDGVDHRGVPGHRQGDR
jgi:MFS family permease